MADSTADRASIQEEIKAQGIVVRQLKADKAPKEKVWSASFFHSCQKGLCIVVQRIDHYRQELVSYVSFT